MTDAVATVAGDSGPPVLLLAGGASSSHGFFPGVEAALPGCRVVSLDRPGTGRAQDRGTADFATGTAAAVEVLAALGAGPAVVVGQSLGGALAVQLALDAPQHVAGLVLVDPTPLDTPRVLRQAEWTLRVLGVPGRLPRVGPRVERRLMRLLLGGGIAPEAEDAFDVLALSAPLPVTVRALARTYEETAALVPRLRPLSVPVVVLTADRRAHDPVRQSHVRLAEALGGRLVAPAGAVHTEHLRDPAGVNALVAEVVAEAFATR